MKNFLNDSAISFATLLVTTVSVLAQSPFGETGERWAIGANLEQKGDFDSAIIIELWLILNLDHPTLLDPTAGGDSIPFESLHLPYPVL